MFNYFGRQAQGSADQLIGVVHFTHNDSKVSYFSGAQCFSSLVLKQPSDAVETITSGS